MTMGAQLPVYKDASADIEARIADLLGRMTPEEKARQLDQYFGTGLVDRTHPRMDTVVAEDAVILWDKVRQDIGDLGVGCVHDLYAFPALSNELQRYAVERTRLGIPILFSEEALHGLGRPGFTVFPQALTQAATWNEELVRRVGRGIAAEVRSVGVCETFAPVIDLARDPRWGRMEETYGEDTYLSARMAAAMVRGLQGDDLTADDSIIAEPKHFAAYGNPVGGLNMSPCPVGPHELHRDYLPVFRAAFAEAGALNAMCSYNSIDGTPCSADRDLLTGVLRDQWGMRGFVRSDLGAIQRLLSEHCVAASEREAIRMALLAGVDMQYYDFPHDVYQNAIVEMLADGTLPADVLDRAVARVLRVKFLLGLFEKPYTDPELHRSRVRCPAHLDVALDTAREAICLLKNEGALLPLTAAHRRIAVIGPGADQAALGDYTPVIEGFRPVTVLDGIRAVAPVGTEIVYAQGVHFTQDMLDHIPQDYLRDGDGRPGLWGEYYNNPDLSGEPTLVRLDAQVNFNWIITKPDERITAKSYSVRWTGRFRPGKTADGRIGVSGYDSMRLWLDGRLIVDHWGPEKATVPIVSFRFEGGRDYDIRMEYVKDQNGVDVLLGWSMDDDDFQAAVAAAAGADVAVVVLGDNAKTCGEGIDRCELTLPGRQLELLQAIHATGTPTVLVLQNGRAPAIPWEAEHIPAIIEAWYPGEQGGRAVAEVLFGLVTPSGKLPVSLPRSVGHLPCYYNRQRGGRTAYVEGESLALYPFGHGLSYTAFAYENLRLPSKRIPAAGEAQIAFDLVNAGDMSGMETVQLYVRDEVSSMVRPDRELKQFRKVALQPGERKTVAFTLTAQDLQTLDRNLNWVVEPGRFQILIGSSSRDIRLTATLDVE